MRRPATLHKDTLKRLFVTELHHVLMPRCSAQLRHKKAELNYEACVMHSNYAGSPKGDNAHSQQGVQVPLGATGDLRLAPDQLQRKDVHGIRPSDAATARTQQIPHTRG